MRDGAELVSEEFFPLFRSVVTSFIKERGGVVAGETTKSATGADGVMRATRRLSGRQRLVITR